VSEKTDDVPTTEAEEKVKEAINRVRPLNATQSRYLLKLVENDFAQLRAEITEMADEQRKAKLKEATEGATADQLKVFGDRAYDLVNDFAKKRRDLIDEAKAQGISLNMPNPHSGQSVTTSDDELQNKIRKINAEHDTELRAVINILNRKKLEAERKVMIATITTATEDILHAIPKARELMLEAAQERAQRQEDAKQLSSGVYNPGAN